MQVMQISILDSDISSNALKPDGSSSISVGNGVSSSASGSTSTTKNLNTKLFGAK